ncbi:X-box-binding protein 1-like protein [Dinothrombium tinctorium]|uniref:X-box-binding protein 1 n=1 Tax=Dinothrombium tinctorium TaxID=1965070 RepID=A0A3S3SBU6_9ACAR|nr:X-box-binding protein 1-like protein [Dinothrombium tinctorium]
MLIDQMLATSVKREILDSSDSMDSSNEDVKGVKRKRERLDHLSLEEKLQRRKLKNRVSAQTARDRKKAKIMDLESRFARSVKENLQMQTENELLRKKNEALELENYRLRLQLQRTSNEMRQTTEETGNAKRIDSLDEAIHSLVSDDAEDCDEVLKWLAKCSENLLRFEDDAKDPRCESESRDFRPLQTFDCGNVEQKSLDTIKNLIYSDHIYHKRPPETETSTKPSQIDFDDFLTNFDRIENQTLDFDNLFDEFL